MIKKTTKFLIAFLLLLSFGNFYGQQVKSIRNGVSWFDTDGNRIQAHGASIIKQDGVYYMIGEDRSKGFGYAGISMYSSTDLMNWTFLNHVVDKQTNAQLQNGERFTERPNLVYNETTGNFVIWAKYQNGNYNAGEVAIFKSSTIDGDYTFVKAFQPLGYDANDSTMFVDDDGTAYYIANNKGNHSLNLYKLTDDYLDVVNEQPAILFPNKGKEAPVLFKKDGIYYMLTSHKTGWEPNQGQYATSTSLTSGWSSFKNFGNKITYDTQPTTLVTVTGTAGTSYFYVGDRWKDPDLRESKLIMLPINVSNGNLSMDYTHEFKIDMDAGTWAPFDDNSYVPQNNWSVVSVSSQETSASDNRAKLAFDNNINTFWHTKYSAGNDQHPHTLVINLGTDYTVSGFMYVPRQDNSPNGIISDFQLFLSTDGNNWGAPVASGRLDYWSELYFPTTTAHYMKLVSRSDLKGTRYASAAELRLMTNTGGYKSMPVNAWRNLDKNGWQNNTEVNVNKGSTIQFGPQIQGESGQVKYYGSFSWYGPNNFYANSRGTEIENIQKDQLGDYTFYYLNDRFYVQKTTFHVKSTTLSVANKTSDDGMFLYPNPVKNLVHIHSGTSNTHYNVYNVMGQKIMDKKGKTINVSSLTKGLYIVRIKDKAFKIVRK